MATSILEFNNLNFKAMNKKSTVCLSERQIRNKNYHQEGIGTITILMAIATIGIIFYSIYNGFL